MTGYAVVSKTGRVAGSEIDYIFYPRTIRAGKRGVVLCHGAGYDLEFADPAQPNCTQIAAALAHAGIPCIAGAFGSWTVGNDTGLARVGSAWSVLQSECGVASDKVLLLGVSMGASNAIRYAQTNPTKVAGILGAIPAVDPNDIYQNDRGGNRAAVGTAWGVTYPTALPSRALLSDPANEALIASQFPMQLYYSSGDAVVVPSTVTAFATATGATATVCSSAAHGDTALAGISLASVVSFMTANGA